MKRNLYIFVLFLTFSACSKKNTDFTYGKADFSNTIVIGGNFMSGYQDGGLNIEGQKKSLGALVIQQLQKTNPFEFVQPLLPDGEGIGVNSKYWEYNYQTPSVLGYKTDCKGVTSLSPIKKELSTIVADGYFRKMSPAKYHDFSVPFASTTDMLAPAFGNNFLNSSKPFYARFAANPGFSTLAQDAQAMQPKFVVAWLGMEDIYNYASIGAAGAQPSSPTDFAAKIDAILKPMVNAGAKGVLANIPDFRNFPYYTTVKWDNADISQTQADSLNDIFSLSGLTDIFFKKGRNGFVIKDVNATGGYRQLQAGEYITLSVPLDSMKCYKYGLIVNVIDNRYALDKYEVQKIDETIAAYNAVLAQKANEYGFAFADIASYFKEVQKGIKSDGAAVNLDFVTGGFISLDGYHPHQKGYALLANEFINAINLKYQATVPKLYCTDCNGVKFP
jgi:hypothetical protein